MGKPSITYKGSLLALMDVPPRILIRIPAPGVPSVIIVFTPDILPFKACSTVGLNVLSMVSEPILVMAPVTSLLSSVP